MAQINLDKATDRRDKYLNDRGTYICDRSKSKWYQEGEKGSKYFSGKREVSGQMTSKKSPNVYKSCPKIISLAN